MKSLPRPHALQGTYYVTLEDVFYQRVSPLDGQQYTQRLSCTEAQFLTGQAQVQQGVLIQDAFSFLSTEEREFMLSGITPTQWNRLFPPKPPLSQQVVETILEELRPVINDLFGGVGDRPLDVSALTQEAVREYDSLPDEPTQFRVQQWVQAWAERKKFYLI